MLGQANNLNSFWVKILKFAPNHLKNLGLRCFFLIWLKLIFLELLTRRRHKLIFLIFFFLEKELFGRFCYTKTK